MSLQSRIDYWLISKEMDSLVIDTIIEPSVLSDHKMIRLLLNVTATPTQKQNPYINYWKLNNSLLKDEVLKIDIIKIIKKTTWSSQRKIIHLSEDGSSLNFR